MKDDIEMSVNLLIDTCPEETLSPAILKLILAREKKLLEELREIYASNDLAFGKLVTNIIDQKLKERE